MINYYLLGKVVFGLGVFIGIGYTLRYINDNWFGGKARRKYEEEKEERQFPTFGS